MGLEHATHWLIRTYCVTRAIDRFVLYDVHRPYSCIYEKFVVIGKLCSWRRCSVKRQCFVTWTPPPKVRPRDVVISTRLGVAKAVALQTVSFSVSGFAWIRVLHGLSWTGRLVSDGSRYWFTSVHVFVVSNHELVVFFLARSKRWLQNGR